MRKPISKTKVIIGFVFSFSIAISLYFLINPDKLSFIMGTNNISKFGNHYVKMRRGWYAYSMNESNQSVSFVKGGIFSALSPHGHIHVHFLKNTTDYFQASATKNSMIYKAYPWGTARLLNQFFYSETLKITPPKSNQIFFVPEKNIFIDVLALQNIDEIDELR